MEGVSVVDTGEGGSPVPVYQEYMNPILECLKLANLKD